MDTEKRMLRYRGNRHLHNSQALDLLQHLRTLLDLPALVVADGALDVHVDQIGLRKSKHTVSTVRTREHAERCGDAPP